MYRKIPYAVLVSLHDINLSSARFAVRTKAARKAIVEIIHHTGWLTFALSGWVVVSLLSLPLIGRFVGSSLRERPDEIQRSSEARFRPAPRQGLAAGGVTAPSGRP